MDNRIVTIETYAFGLLDVVPKETQITDLIEYVSLEELPEIWADAVLGYKNGYKRNDTSSLIKRAGYDINTTTQRLQNFYLKISERR